MRCAIYTRKSHDERADSQLGSTERQRELCEAYIASQAGRDWISLPDHYDDIGFSGGTLKRPALERLLAHVAAGSIDAIIVYKIDRLSRSLRDFLSLIDIFDRQGVAFESITQSFCTTSSMGKLTLNMLLSFAQFERELTGERLRDWFAGARERGLWPRRAPFGYIMRNCHLFVHPEQAEIVRFLFTRYPVVGSAKLLAKEANARGYLNRDGRPWRFPCVTRIIKNRLYLGEQVHQGQSSPGIHEPIVTERQWSRVQKEIAASARRRAAYVRPQVHSPLKGLIIGPHGGNMIHVFVHRRSRTYRYYVASTNRYRETGVPRFRAPDIERIVTSALTSLIGATWPDDPHEAEGVIRRLVDRIELKQKQLTIYLHSGARLSRPHAALIVSAPRKRRSREHSVSPVQ